MSLESFALNGFASAAGNIVSDGIEGLVSFASGKLLRTSEHDYGTLKRAAALLQAQRDDNERRVQQNKTKTTSSYYNQWLNSVMIILEEVETLKAQYEQERNLLSNVVNRSHIFERVQQISQEVHVLLKHGQFQAGFLVDKPPDPIVKMSPPDIKMFHTLQEQLEKILQFLSTDRVSMESNKEMLQLEIARRLKLNLQDKGPLDRVAESISEELKDKKYLLLLDDVMDFIDLQAIGIPGNNNGSKVVLTTEFRHICHSIADKMVKVNPLSSDEAWLMFQQIVTDKIDLPDVEPVAQQVAEECDGLPLLVNIVANSFKLKNSVDEWRNGLEELRNWSEVEIPGLTEIHTFIKFCYDDLKDEKKRICLLYVALHLADTMISTDYLVKCWAAERFLGSIDDRRSFRTACDKGYAILGHLSNVSLLHTDKKMEHVHVSNMVRQVAFHISSEENDCKFLIGETKTSTASLEVNDWEQAKRIFMIDTKLDHLPNTPRCSMLLSLLLQKNPDLKTIPPLFFRTMKKLLVLNLYSTGIGSLPPSFECLTGLKALFLNNCTSLTSLPLQIEKLCLLEVLDIQGCKIIFIPPSIGKLVYLRCLKVSYYKPSSQNGCEELEVDYNVISRLSRLEELEIDVISCAQWCIEATNIILHVIASLEKLTSLKIYFPKLELLQNLLENKTEWQGRQKLTSFWFFVGRPSSNPPEILDCFNYKINRYLRYCHNGNDHSSTISNVFPETDALELIGHDNIRCLLDFIQAPGLNRVRGCLVEGCNSMELVVDDNNARDTNILSSLEQLHLRNLPVLRSILEGPISERSLSKLHTIVVESCPMLTKISSDGLIFATIKKLVIQNCSKIEVLIMNTGGYGSMQNLEILELLDMAQFRTISEDTSLAWSQLKELHIYKCPELKMLPFKKGNAKELKLIKGEQTWWDALEWENNEIREHFQSIYIPKVSVFLRGPA
ncbi:hypothetical protein SLEP1_g58992 [Rubroshorea leprosula]|uniref:NB-ARC domain-containing protein n=1 Tax=Rubroshorea leprosula TaxID=152421 RepID=A0AAV5MSL4_9ROSI|nr:hypothetical protein SLEP1_g58992 [Rubroshorea leprosula]